MKRKRLMRSKDNRILAGVIGGIAEYLDVDASILYFISDYYTIRKKTKKSKLLL